MWCQHCFNVLHRRSLSQALRQSKRCANHKRCAICLKRNILAHDDHVMVGCETCCEAVRHGVFMRACNKAKLLHYECSQVLQPQHRLSFRYASEKVTVGCKYFSAENAWPSGNFVSVAVDLWGTSSIT